MGTLNLLQIKVLDSLVGISEPDWHALQESDFPFGDYSFLSTLESTGCLGPRTGWTPVYITAWQGEQLVGALLLYAKDNSYGEFIFDFNWADASYGAGIPYYPKLVSAIPFTPVTGTKILTCRHLDPVNQESVAKQLLGASFSLLKDSDASSLHCLFIPKTQVELYQKQKAFVRHSFQYHWVNQDYRSFGDFLTSLKGKRRREVVRERSQVEKQGIRIQQVTGTQLTDQHSELMYGFYQSTMDKKQGFEFLTRDFFKTIFSKMKEKILFVIAYDTNNQPVAGALNFIGSERLFGRYWGCRDEYRALHFEVCYYQGIEYCIKNNLKIFEAGAQGEHKFNRGFLPSFTYSAHIIQHPGLNHAIKSFVEKEKAQLDDLFKSYDEHNPYNQ